MQVVMLCWAPRFRRAGFGRSFCSLGGVSLFLSIVMLFVLRITGQVELQIKLEAGVHLEPRPLTLAVWDRSGVPLQELEFHFVDSCKGPMGTSKGP